MSERSSRKKIVTMQPKPSPDAWVSEGRERNASKTEHTKRLTLDIPEDLHKALKQRALDEDTTMLDLVEGWIREHLRD
jgi:hypothetical protein